MESKDLKEKPRKISTTMIIFVACVFGLGIGLLSLNYWHATNCNNNRPPDQTEEYINAFNRRLLHAESQVSFPLFHLNVPYEPDCSPWYIDT
jgi:hypothetical protein